MMQTLIRFPSAVLAMLALLVIFGVVLHYSVFGRSVLALGGNEEAARLAGIPVKRTRLLVFVLQGLVAGLAGVLLAAQLQNGDPNAAQGLELKVISACVLGEEVRWNGGHKLDRVVRDTLGAFVRFVSIFSFVAMLYLFIIAVVDLPNPVVLALAFVGAGLLLATVQAVLLRRAHRAEMLRELASWSGYAAKSVLIVKPQTLPV